MPLGLAIFTLCNLNNGKINRQKTTLYQKKFIVFRFYAEFIYR